MQSSSLPAQPPALPPSCSLVGAPPCCPPAPAGLCLVCVYAYGCPGWLQPGECDMRLPFHGCPCESGGQASHCVRVCMCVHGRACCVCCIPLHRVSSPDCAWEKGHIEWVPTGGRCLDAVGPNYIQQSEPWTWVGRDITVAGGGAGRDSSRQVTFPALGGERWPRELGGG